MFLQTSQILKDSCLNNLLNFRARLSLLPVLFRCGLLPNWTRRKLRSQVVEAAVISVCSLISRAFSSYSKRFCLAEQNTFFFGQGKSFFLLSALWKINILACDQGSKSRLHCFPWGWLFEGVPLSSNSSSLSSTLANTSCQNESQNTYVSYFST